MKTTLELVQELDLPEEMERMAVIFDQGMPDTLYMNHYELAGMTGIPPEQWEDFLDLKEIQRFIQSKMAKLAETAARKAIRELERRGTESSSGAIKALNEHKAVPSRPQRTITIWSFSGANRSIWT